MVTRSVASLVVLACVASLAAASQPALVRLERTPGLERNALLDAGLPVVEEMEECFLAIGDPDLVLRQAAVAGIPAAVVDDRADGGEYALIGLLSGTPRESVATCGETVWGEANWVVVKASSLDDGRCASPGWLYRPLGRRVLGRTVPPPAEYTGELQLTPKPMVQDMVDAMTGDRVQEHWERIVNVASTRYSTSAGCTTAAQMVYNLFQSYGLNPQNQSHTGGHAPNVIGTIPGSTTPGNVYIAIGHLDDMPSSGSAPGADDNASGTAMVTALAEVMSCYEFANTVKFLAVTGEEFGLYGSEYYADHNPAGDNIQAVLNADMISYEGEGPRPEDLDINLNTTSTWLGTLMTQAAAEYGTGCAINAFQCATMAYSDHWPFWQNGWSAVCGITDNLGFCGQPGDYPYYHTSNDTIANNGDPAFFYSAVRAYVATLAHLADPVSSRAPAPNGVLASPDGDNRVAVSWSSSGSGLTFTVLRAPGGCGGALAWVPVGETTGLSLVDTTASGGMTYAYAVRAHETAGSCTSSLSECVEASTTGACTEPPAFAGAAAVEDDHGVTCSLTVTWPAAATYCGGTATYSVYRSTEPDFVPSDGNRIASGLTGTGFVDASGLVSGTTYHYLVRATDTGNGVEEGNLVRRSGAPSGPYSIGTWTDDAGDTGTAKLIPTSPWSVATSGGHNAPKVYATGNYGNNVCSGVATPTLHLGAGSQLTFWSKYDIESSWDKGEVQASTDGGSTWTRVAVNYPGNSTNTSDACDLPNGTYFTGTNTTWAQYSGSLNTWSNLDVELRWVLSTDGAVTDTGWWVDDITITNVMVPGTCETGASQPLFADDFEDGTTGVWSSVLP